MDSMGRIGSGGAASRRLPAIWAVPSLLTAGVVVTPLIYIFLRAWEQGFRAYLSQLTAPLIRSLLAQTLWLTVGVVFLCLLIAVPMAWLVARTDLPGRRWWAVLGALPLVFPSYVSALTLVVFWGPKGTLQGWLEPLGVERLPQIAYGYSGALLALALFTYPYVFLPLVAALRGLDPALEESGRVLGRGPWRVFGSVILPQLRGTLYAGSLLVVLYTLSDFGAVSIVRYNTFTMAIYNAYRGLFDRTGAASLATVLVLLTLLVLWLEGRLASRQRPHRSRPARQPPPVALGAWRWPAVGALGLLACLNVLLPAAVLGFWGIRGLARGDSLGAVTLPALRSLSISTLAAVVAVLLAIPIAVWTVRQGGRLARFVERLTYAGYALPGLVIALALVFFSIRYARPLYQTLPLLGLAYVVRFLPEATSSARSSLADLAPSFEEAARSLGRGPVSVLWTITVPVILPSLLAGGGLVFLTSMKELPATLILRPTGFDTLATEIWSYASEAIYHAAALPSLLLLLVTAPPLYYLVIRPALARRSHA